MLNESMGQVVGSKQIEQGLLFTPIKDESSRTYWYPDGKYFTIYGADALCVRPSGSHRIQSGNRKWIVSPGWLTIEIIADAWSL